MKLRTALFLLLLFLANLPVAASAFPGPPLAPADRYCAVARAGGYVVRVYGYVRENDRATVTLALAGGGDAEPIALSAPHAHGSPVALPTTAPDGYDPDLAWYALTLPSTAVNEPIRLQIDGEHGKWLTSVRLLHPVCERPLRHIVEPETTPASPLPASQVYQAHIVQPDDLNPVWSEADLQTLAAAHLPFPATATSLVNVFAAAPPGSATASVAPRPDDGDDSGWTPLMRAGFDAGWPWTGQLQACRLVRMASRPGQGWTVDHARAFAGSAGSAAPPAGDDIADNARRVHVVQVACVFDDLAAAHNLMAEFALLLDPADTAGSFFVGASTDGRNFVGRRWRAVDAGDARRWTQQRVFFPFIDALTARSNGRLAVMWEYRQAAGATNAPGVRLDALSVERFDPPVTACRDLDPAFALVGAPGRALVSKGLNLPPYLDAADDGLAGHVARLQASGVNWARVELQAALGAGTAADKLVGRPGQLGYVDLKHYDTLFHLLCTGNPPTAVLGLLGYHMLPDGSWRSTRTAADYRVGFGALSATLVRYFADRVRAWEIWNEPDHPSTYLAPADFAHLLANSYATIKGIDEGATVVLGGLSGAGATAAGYLRRVLAALPADTPGYDVLGLHPYPSTEFRTGGQVIRDPSYLRSYAPTVVARFMEVMRAAGHADRPIWVTEIGWNRAADSTNPATQGCPRIAATMVTGAEQAAFLPEAFDILFKETGWDDATPGVVKIFWYQYGDVGLAISAAECTGVTRTGGSAAAIVDWWYGLYSGTDAGAGILEPRPNRVECTYRAYPDAAALAACTE